MSPRELCHGCERGREDCAPAFLSDDSERRVPVCAECRARLGAEPTKPGVPACDWCENLGGGVTAAGNVADWATEYLAPLLAQRVHAGGEYLGAERLREQRTARLAEIAAGLDPATGHGEASEWLARFAVGGSDFDNGPERALSALVAVLPYPVLAEAVRVALILAACECRGEGCMECADMRGGEAF